jgi:hypothetical protein
VSQNDRPIPNDRGPQWHSQRSPGAAGWRLTSTRNSYRYPRIVPLMRRQRSTALELSRSCLIVMLRMAKVAIRLDGHFESRFTMFEVRYYFGGFRVGVRWLPIKRTGDASFTNPLVSVAAIFTCAAIRPVNSNPSRNLIPKNEIIWHMQSPPCAMQLRCHNAATQATSTTTACGPASAPVERRDKIAVHGRSNLTFPFLRARLEGRPRRPLADGCTRVEGEVSRLGAQCDVEPLLGGVHHLLAEVGATCFSSRPNRRQPNLLVPSGIPPDRRGAGRPKLIFRNTR